METETRHDAVVHDSTAWHHLVPRLLQDHGSRTVAEIGVWKGELSERILLNCPLVKHLLLVDPWQVVYGHDPVRDQWMVFGPGLDESQMLNACNRVRTRLGHNERVIILQLPSVKASAMLTDRSFDAIIIDALHTYHACKQDILAWVPKVKVGGLLIGDDMSEWFPGVQVAVEEVFGHDYRALGQTWWHVLTEDDHVRLAGIALESVSQ